MPIPIACFGPDDRSAVELDTSSAEGDLAPGDAVAIVTAQLESSWASGGSHLQLRGAPVEVRFFTK